MKARQHRRSEIMEVRKKIGEGAQGVVYLQKHAERIVAIKKIRTIIGTEHYQKAILETHILKNVKHPHLIHAHSIKSTTRIVEAGITTSSYKEEKIYTKEIQYEVIMDHCSRGTLSNHIHVFLKNPIILVDIFRQILQALDYLHSNNIVHGSLRLENILLDEQNNIKLIDFGDAEIIDPTQPVFGVDMSGIYQNLTAHTDSRNDLRFSIRPCKKQEISLYNHMRAFDEENTIDEDNIGLMAVFRQFFPQKEPQGCNEFYNEMAQIHVGKITPKQSVCKHLLAHPFLILNLEETQMLQRQRKIIFYTPSLGFFKRLHPPIGFQNLSIDPPLRKINPEECWIFKEKEQEFIRYIKNTNQTEVLSNFMRISSEVYQLMKPNSRPENPINLFSHKNKKTYFQELKENNWEICRIYGDEKPAITEIEKTARGYMATQPINNGARQVLFAFMGAEVFPRLPESWWTNDCKDQAEIWGKINFVRSVEHHTGINTYFQKLLISIETELSKKIDPPEEKNLCFNLTGHSTGGVLAILMARYLRKRFPSSTILVIVFATPAFMTKNECDELAREFPNDSHHKIFNLISLTDPALGIYGKNFYQPMHHTIFIVPCDFAGESFLNVHAANKDTTMKYIENHSPKNYQKIVSNLLESNHSIRPKL